MDKDNKEKKIVTIFKKFIDVDESVKRVPIYFFFVCVLLVIMIFKLGQTNEYLKVLAENSKNSVEYETFDDTFIEIVTENTKDKEDYLPLLEELTDDEITSEESTTRKQENSSKETTTKIVKETTTDSTTTQKSDDNVSRKTYILNTSSKKIHSTTCSFLPKNEENKKSVELSDNELNDYINNGYEVCKKCGGK